MDEHADLAALSSNELKARLRDVSERPPTAGSSLQAEFDALRMELVRRLRLRYEPGEDDTLLGPEGDGPAGGAGVREPRTPRPSGGSGAIDSNTER